MVSPTHPQVKRGALLFLMVFLLFVFSGVHGFSLPIWRDIIDGPSETKPEEIISGRVRVVRADDWRVTVPSAIAQRYHTPAFPVINTNIGFGQNMLVVNGAPVLHPASLFRPLSWGYFISDDAGVSWHWWFRVLGAAAASLWLFSLVTGGDRVLTAFGSVIFLYSPFLQYWSLNSGDMIFFGALSSYGFLRLISAVSYKEALIGGGLTGWAFGCLALSLYPPFAIAIMYSVAAVVLSVVNSEFRRSYRNLLWSKIVVGATVALCVFACAGASFWLGAADAIKTMLNTSYPGQRLALGGDLSWVHVFGNHALNNISYDYHRNIGGNICESGGFLLFYPLTLWLIICDAVYCKTFRSQMMRFFPLIAVCGLFHVWIFIGAPPWLARLTGFSFIPGNRAIVGLGLADLALLLAYLWIPKAIDAQDTLPKAIKVLGLLLWGVFIGYLFIEISKVVPKFSGTELSWRWLLAIIIAGLIVFRKSRAAVIALALTSVATTQWFNPVVRSGTKYLQSNALSTAMKSLSKPDSAWIVVGSSAIVDLPRALGVSSIGGALFTPNLELWRQFDPDQTNHATYNRYAMVSVNILPPTKSAEFTLLNSSEFEAKIPIDHPALVKLGVDHLVVEKTNNYASEVLANSTWQIVRSESKWNIWSRR